MLILGVDDAGRGPLIGPMILAGVLAEKPKEKLFKSSNIRDSKLVPHNERIKLSKLIKQHSIKTKIISTFPEEIDKSLKTGTNLNTLEAIKAASVINYLNPKNKSVKVILDCPSTNTIAWKNTLLKYVRHPGNLTILCEHKADFNYPIVSAASILAKVQREEEVEKLKKQYGNFGSGYPRPKNKGLLKGKRQGIKRFRVIQKVLEHLEKNLS